MAYKAHTTNTTSIIDGLRVPRKLRNVEEFRLGLQYSAQSSDLFIVTYPQSGMHWMSMIVYQLLNGAQQYPPLAAYGTKIQFLERHATSLTRGNTSHPDAIQTNYPFDRVPYHSKAKYICVIRQPKDVCIAMYRSLTEDPSFQLSIDFTTFFEDFIEGKTYYNGYFEHLRSIWSHKDDENVLLVSYEKMKKDLRNVILRVAQFLNIDINEKKELMDNVEKYASYESVRQSFSGMMSSFLEFYEVGLSDFNPVPMGTMNYPPPISVTDEQSERLDMITAEQTRDMPGLAAFWQP